MMMMSVPPYLEKVRFCWDDLPVSVVQSPLQQTQDGCAFTATTLQLDYQWRIANLQSGLPQVLPPGPILDHVKWEELLRTKFPRINRWKPWDLLHEAADVHELTKHCDVPGHSGQMGSGVPDVNNVPHWVDIRQTIDNFSEMTDDQKVALIGRKIEEKIPVIGVFHVYKDFYPLKADRPYTGLRHDNKTILVPPTSKERWDLHSVVLVGDCILKDNNPWGMKSGTYWLYQDSVQPDGQPHEGLLGNFIGIVHPRLVIEAYYGVSWVPNLMVGKLGTNATARERRKRNDHLTRERKLIADRYH